MTQRDASRLSAEQWQQAHDKASHFRDLIVKMARQKAANQTAFYPELFRVAAPLIEKDTDDFCDRAEEVFDEIDAFGQEPQLDGDWLAEVTGERDTFYFSTDSLVSQLPPLPSHKKSKTPSAPEEKAITQAVEEAISSREDALAVAHHETPQLWIEKIFAALKKEPGAVSFGHLLLTTNLSPGALFLGLLLGHQHWHTKQKSFYGEVTVQLLSQAGCLDPAKEINDKLS